MHKLEEMLESKSLILLETFHQMEFFSAAHTMYDDTRPRRYLLVASLWGFLMLPDVSECTLFFFVSRRNTATLSIRRCALLCFALCPSLLHFVQSHAKCGSQPERPRDSPCVMLLHHANSPYGPPHQRIKSLIRRLRTVRRRDEKKTELIEEWEHDNPTPTVFARCGGISRLYSEHGVRTTCDIA